MGEVWSCVRMDVARYGGWRTLLTEQSLWAVLWFRLGSALLLIRLRPLRRVCLVPWFVIYKVLETTHGISLPLGLKVGGGLRIWHFGGIFVNVKTVIGCNCTLRQGVTLGSRYDDGPGPILGDNVDLGAYAQVLGEVRIGDDARIGGMTVVLCDVPDGCTAVGVPARVLPSRTTGASGDAASQG
ncbi:MAG: serine acetyltransferase [Burkholderiales bacterium]|jgi:serine O-acetyltransferase|nr:MAG: serine acetyltransferase [Burkholderiales bacterium]